MITETKTQVQSRKKPIFSLYVNAVLKQYCTTPVVLVLLNQLYGDWWLGYLETRPAVVLHPGVMGLLHLHTIH